MARDEGLQWRLCTVLLPQTMRSNGEQRLDNINQICFFDGTPEISGK